MVDAEASSDGPLGLAGGDGGDGGSAELRAVGFATRHGDLSRDSATPRSWDVRALLFEYAQRLRRPAPTGQGVFFTLAAP